MFDELRSFEWMFGAGIEERRTVFFAAVFFGFRAFNNHKNLSCYTMISVFLAHVFVGQLSYSRLDAAGWLSWVVSMMNWS